MRYRSSFFIMLYNFIWTILGGIGIMLFLTYILSKFIVIRFSYLYPIGIIIFIVCAIYSITTGYVIVNIGEREVTIKNLISKKGKLEFDKYVFSSRICTHSINFIPTQVERFLIIFDGNEEKEIKLSNFSKKSFDKVLAILNKKTLDKEEIKSSLKKEIFNIPKEDILEEHMRLLKKYVILATGVAIILSSGLYFLVKKNSGGREMAPLLGIMILFNILMFGIPGIAIFYEYIKKRNEIPERIYVDIDNINIDGKVYSMKEIKKIVATPASYEEGLIGKNFRKIIIYTTKNKKILHLGARAVAGINKIVYEEYNELCNIIEKSAVMNDVEFMYDL
ncbi:DUF2909 domain-containing protein [Fusobacterium varium]|jgi:hypothetical protein|uniref:DUF304 domain-containing protein n=1 Tax=Fusobacterium varium ATCC 27725 TaxID=469618 RepID=A0ABM6U3F5_FUSVA|nr:DUF2909 domain-containing protein [Fusobacterium varium]AVQ30847.1 hypothetical protein C4N18_06345 [Fusobacterium varium ATCC 27725]EES63657.1 hypothetical protein FVAG_02265 [Fusobacterium varium ATCC 27725]VEH40514.1 Uncharacterised protein [Fusobacterium varium]